MARLGGIGCVGPAGNQLGRLALGRKASTLYSVAAAVGNGATPRWWS